MKEVRVPFLEEFQEPMLNCVKTWTARNEIYGEPGDYFHAFNVRFTIVQVVRRNLREVAFLYWREEGCRSPEHFIAVWNRLHPRKGYDPEHLVWHHEFRLEMPR